MVRALIIFVILVFFMPNFQGHPDNYIEANPLSTPAHIVPEWDEEDIDLENYKGIYFNDDPGRKFQDELTGAHFEFSDMCGRLDKLRTL